MNTDLIKAQDVQFLSESTTYELEDTEPLPYSKKCEDSFYFFILAVAFLVIGSILALVAA